MRRSLVAFAVLLAVSGCIGTTSVTSVSSLPPPTSAATPPPPTPTPTDAPTPTAAATPGCPADGPMTVATYAAADQSCFGSRDVTLTGWEYRPNGMGSGEMGSYVEPTWLNDPTPSVLVDVLPGQCEAEQCEPFLFVHVNPATKLRFETDEVYVVITGHRADPVAAKCVTIGEEEPPAPIPTPDPAHPGCVDAFVLTSVREVDPPAGALSFCPTDTILTVDQYMTTLPVCFHGKTVKIVAWADAMPGIDFGVEFGILPHWLVYPSAPFTALWDVRPVSVGGSPTCPDGDADYPGSCRWLIAYAKPGSGVSLTPAKRWILLNGHIDDPAAATCHWDTTGYHGPPPPPDDAFARQACRESLVITSVQNTTAPSPAWTPNP